MPLWNEIEGEILDDNLPLQKLLRSEGRTAWFATTGADGQPAVVSVFEALNDEDTALARVQTAARVEHPNLLIIRRTGSTRIGGDPHVFAVIEAVGQTAFGGGGGGPPPPARNPAGVLGVGDSIKLRSDCLTQRHSDSSDAPTLAALVYNALTGRRFSSERDALQLPAPFATLVRAGAGSNGSLASMRRVLSGPAVTSAEAAAVPPPAAKAPVAARSSATPATAPATPRTAANAAATPRAALKQNEGGSRRRKRPGIAIAAIVLMAIALVVFWYITKQPARHAPISGEAASAPNPRQAAPAAVPPAATPTGDAAATPETAKSAPRPEARTEARAAARPAPTNPATDAAPTSGERSVWHVVAYTYLYESAAQRKATELAAQYPKLEPQVFSPTGHAPFLVTLGGGTNRQEAFARRDAARTAGMPSDTYAMNFRK